MKKLVIVLGAIGSTITIFLTANLIYPTRAEVDAKVEGINVSLIKLHEDLKKIDRKVDYITNLLIERHE